MSSVDVDPTLEATNLGAPRVLGAEGLLRKQMIRAALLGDPMGQTVGRYRVERKLGQGGMGAVFAAHDPTLDRTVAIKVLRGPADSDANSVERSRLVREAQALARLRHPAVATVHEVDTHDGQLFLAMEYVEGQTLDDWLAERPRSWQEILTTFVRAGEGLAAAHAADIVHRDFKPANVMVEPDGRVVVLDFGLARSYTDSSLDGENSDESDTIVTLCTLDAQSAGASGDLTMTGTVVGTPAYMSPEQFLAVPVTAASDQFSFCVALYEALSGQRPFTGTSIPEQARLVTQAEREVDGLGSVPRRVRRAVLRGLAREADNRWPSMEALLEQLRRALQPSLRWAVALGVGCTLTGLVGVAWLSSEQEEDHLRTEQQLTEVTRKADDAQRMRAAQALQTSDPAAAAALLREVEDPAEVPDWTEASLTLLAQPVCPVVLREHGSEPLQTIEFSPDGRHLLTGSRDYTARLWSRDGRNAPWVAQDGGSMAARFSPDGTTIATVGTIARLWRWDGREDPTGPTVLPGGAKPLTDDTTRAIAFDPTGRHLATGSTSGAVYLWSVPEGSASPQEPRVLRGHDAVIWSVVFSPDGTRLLSASVDGSARLWSLAEATEPVVLEHEGRVFAAHFSPDGAQVLTASFDRAARLWSTADGSLMTRWNHDNALLSATFTRDGRRVAIGDDRGEIRLWDVTAPDRPSVLLRGHEQAVTALVPSPDGQTLASTSQDGTAAIWTLSSRNDPPGPSLVIQAGESLIDAAYSPDGRSLALAAQAGTVRVCPTAAPTATAVRETPGRTLSLAATPDGRQTLVGSSAGSTRLGHDASALPITLDTESRVTRVAIDARGSTFVTREANGNLRAWSGAERPILDVGIPRSNGPIAIDRRGDRIAAAGPDATLTQWIRELDQFAPAGTIEIERTATALAYTDHALLIGDERGRVLTWTHGAPDPTLADGSRGLVTRLVPSPRGERLATAHRGGQVVLWRATADGWNIDRALDIEGEVSAMAWVEPKGALLVMTWAGRVLRTEGDGDWTTIAALPLQRESALGLLLDGGRIALTASGHAGDIHRWALDHFDPDPAKIGARLWDVTTECLPPEVRAKSLGIDDDSARAESERCRARFGR